MNFQSRINDWPRPVVTEFQQFLRQLGSMDFPRIFMQMTSRARSELKGQINFHYTYGTIQTDLMGWFYHFYNMRYTHFSEAIWAILKEDAQFHNDGDAIRQFINGSQFAPMFQGVPDWQKLMNAMEAYVGLTTELDNWIAAAVHAVPGCGILFSNHRGPTRSWLTVLRNQNSSLLLLLGSVLLYNQECTDIVQTIRAHGFAAEFGLGAEPPRVIPVSVAPSPQARVAPNPQARVAQQLFDWKAELRQRLNKNLIGKWDEVADQDEAIRAVLIDPEIKRFLLIELPWLLPGNSTLYDLLTNASPHWTRLVAALVEFAERGLERHGRSAFPVLDIRDAFKQGLEAVAKVPLVELMVYDPLLNEKQRDERWRKMASTLMPPETLLRWLGKEASAKLTAEQILRGYHTVMAMVAQPQTAEEEMVKFELLNRARQQYPETALVYLDNLLEELFPKPVQQHDGQVDYSDPIQQVWTAAQLLTELGIANQQLLAEFGTYEREEIALVSKADWPKRLRKMGAQGKEDLRITAAMVKMGLIE